MRNEYPTEDALAQISNWDYKQGFQRLLDLIESIWWNSEWGFKLYKGRDSFSHKAVMKLELHTAGWSGNEDIIDALQSNTFWLLCWKESQRGGHYKFEIPFREKQKNE